MHLTFERTASALAVIGGLLVVTIALVTTGSVLSRWLLGIALQGDTEIIEYGMAAVVACFLPLCQWRGGNVIVDFVTARAPAPLRQALDRVGALSIALMLGLVGWRTGAGALDQYRYGAETMLLQWPLWPVLLLMALAIGLASLLALYTAATGRNGARADAQSEPGPASGCTTGRGR